MDRRWTPHSALMDRHTAGLLGMIALLAGCSGSGVPMPRLPQVEQAQEVIQGGGERNRAHQACLRSSSSAEDLVRCMAQSGFTFVVRSPTYPEAECWQLRERDDSNQPPPPHCFVRPRIGPAANEPAERPTGGSAPKSR